MTLPEAKNALSLTIFEDQPPFTNNAVAAEFVKIGKERKPRGVLPTIGNGSFHPDKSLFFVAKRSVDLCDREGSNFSAFQELITSL